MNCPDHGKVKGVIDKRKSYLTFGFPICPICKKELHCPEDKIQCPHAGEFGLPPSNEYCLQCETLEESKHPLTKDSFLKGVKRNAKSRLT